MMLYKYLSISNPGNPKVLTNWVRVIDSIKPKASIAQSKYINAPLVFNKVQIMVKYVMLTVMEYPAMCNILASDISPYYSEFVIPLTDIAKRSFDTTLKALTTSGAVIESQDGSRVPEVWVSTTRKNPLVNIDFGADWNVWKDIKVIKLISHDSSYLNLDMNQGAFVYSADVAPTHAVIALDPACLWVKFFKWLKFTNNLEVADTAGLADKFIHEYILPDLFEDQMRIFTINIMKYLFSGDMDSWNASLASLKNDWRIALSGFEAGCVDLYTCLELVKKHSMSVDDFLVTDLIPSIHGGNYSLRSVMVDYLTNWTIPDLRQFNWVTILRDIDIMTIIASILRLYPDVNIFNRVSKEMLYILNTYKRSLPWGYIPTAAFKMRFVDEINKLSSLLSINDK